MMSGEFATRLPPPVPDTNDIEIGPLTAATIEDNIEAILDIASEVPCETWAAAHFLMDLPAKWRLSIAAWAGAVPVAYAIVSEKTPGHAHLHHFMVHRRHRNGGLGARLLDHTEETARDHGCRSLTLKVYEQNHRAQQFYLRHRYAESGHQGEYVIFGRTL